MKDIASKHCIDLLLKQQNASSILFIFDKPNQTVANQLEKCIAEQFPNISANFQLLTKFNLEQLDALILQYDRVIAIYDINPVNSSEVETKQLYQLRQKIYQHFDKITRVCDLSQDFNDFFSVPNSYFIELNQKIIDAAKNIKTIHISNSFGTSLTVQTDTNFSWVNVNGVDPSKIHGSNLCFFEPMFGEVATQSKLTNGIIQFTGAILFSNTQDWKNQLIIEPVTLEIYNGCIVDIQSRDRNVVDLLKKKFAEHEFNSHLSEVGIGTHPAIKLKGQNLIFEERHAGAHLGFGGANGSSHMDFVFSDSIIKFDNKVIFDQGFLI